MAFKIVNQAIHLSDFSDLGCDDPTRQSPDRRVAKIGRDDRQIGWPALVHLRHEEQHEHGDEDAGFAEPDVLQSVGIQGHEPEREEGGCRDRRAIPAVSHGASRLMALDIGRNAPAPRAMRRGRAR
jgi:hypothetical protein